MPTAVDMSRYPEDTSCRAAGASRRPSSGAAAAVERPSGAGAARRPAGSQRVPLAVLQSSRASGGRTQRATQGQPRQGHRRGALHRRPAVPGMLFGATVRSTIPHGARSPRAACRACPAWSPPTSATSPARNVVALIDDDQPCLADDEVRHVAEPVLLLAHADREALADGRRRRRRRVRAAAGRSSIRCRRPRVFKDIAIDKGELARGLAEAALIVEGEYRTGHQEQLYIETNGVIAVPWLGPLTARAAAADAGHDGLRIAAVPLLRAPRAGRRAGPAARAACASCRPRPAAASAARKSTRRCWRATRRSWPLKAGAPVKMIYDRAEDLLATTKRHPSIVRHRTGVAARRPAHRDGHRRGHGRRRLLHAQPGGAVARGDPRHRALPLRSRAHPRPGDDDPHPAQRRLPRLRRAADAVRRRGAPRPRRRGPRPRSGPHPRA